MKVFLVVLVAFFTNVKSNAQIAINKKSVSESAIMEFADGANKGIILPLVSSTVSIPIPGMLIANKSKQTVQYYDGSWKDLTAKGSLPLNTNDSPELNNTDFIIGNKTSSTSGVLVLESNSKALVLPKVNHPETNIMLPRIGMICYDPTSKTLAVYNGTEWSYWK